MPFLTHKTLKALTCALAFALPMPHIAQANPFAAVATVDNASITRFELNQRIAFLKLIRTPAIESAEVRERLIDEHLQVRAAKNAGITVSAQEVQQGLTEFAARADLKPDAFLAAVTAQGVAPETVRDFITSGLYWRKLVQQRFGARARVSDAELERAANLSQGEGAARVLLSEIALPLAPEVEEQAREIAQELDRTLRTPAQFAEAASRFSVAPSRDNQGKLDWLSIGQLPPPVVDKLLLLSPGQRTGVIDMGGYLAIFLMRGFSETAPKAPRTVAVEYISMPFATTAEAHEMKNRVDTCDDFYGTAPLSAYSRDAVAPSRLPGALARTLATLDTNETSLQTTQSGATLIMLCGRSNALSDSNRDSLRTQLFNRRLESYADGYLDELRASARITQ